MKPAKVPIKLCARPEPTKINGSSYAHNGVETQGCDALPGGGSSELLAKRDASAQSFELADSLPLHRLLEEKLALETLRKTRYDLDDAASKLQLQRADFLELFPPEPGTAETELLQLSDSDDSDTATRPPGFPLNIGFREPPTSDARYVVDPARMPPISFFLNEDSGRPFAECERTTRATKTAPKRHAENKGVIRETAAGPSKLRKFEFPLVLSVRMRNLYPRRISVPKDEEFRSFDAIRRDVKRVKARTEAGDLRATKSLEDKWKEVMGSMLKVMKYFQPNDYDQNAKNLALLCAKVKRKANPKTKKLTKEFAVRAKKLWKETQVFWKRRLKEMSDLKKKREKLEYEKRKKDEERQEQQKQRKKIEFLIQKSSIYAEFMAKKLGTDSSYVPVDAPLEPLSSEERGQLNGEVRGLIEENRRHAEDFSKSLQPVDFSQVELENDSNAVEIPHSFRGQLKDYQFKGLRWLDNLYLQGINGILADDMGLGKTIQAIALLAHLTEKYNNWGPFLVIAPATTLFNWSGECAKFCPSLRIMPFWGSKKERHVLRRNLQQKHLGHADSEFHVVITSYQIAVADEKILQRVVWQYIILDEAHSIKNMYGQRWTKLLELRSRNKLLLTGTPIQNTMSELWALLHFIMPKLFDSHEQFQEWFSKDIEAHSQNKQKLNKTQLDRLHAILKPFMLRRVKKDVEKEIGKKHEQEVYCELSSRQKVLYEGLKKRLSLTDFFYIKQNRDKVENLMNLVMQLRKVCNHPDLFERKIVRSPLLFSSGLAEENHSVYSNTEKLSLLRTNPNASLLSVPAPRSVALHCTRFPVFQLEAKMLQLAALGGISNKLAGLLLHRSDVRLLEVLCAAHYLENCRRTQVLHPGARTFNLSVVSKAERLCETWGLTDPFELLARKLQGIFISRIEAPRPRLIYSAGDDPLALQLYRRSPGAPFRMEYPRFSSLITDSCKLKYLDKLLAELAQKNLRVLVFCQMTKMLDILEEFLQYRKYQYLRLDGGCAISDRRDKVKEFQDNSDIFIFLLSTRAGGLGVTLTAADVVIFYDNDWNPTMDAQAADRAHRIGRTGDVYVYRLITKHTIEERIVRRAQQKNIVQQTVYSGEAFKGNVFKTQDVMSLLFDDKEIEEREKKENASKVDRRRRRREDDKRLDAVAEEPGEDETELEQIIVKKLFDEEDNQGN